MKKKNTKMHETNYIFGAQQQNNGEKQCKAAERNKK